LIAGNALAFERGPTEEVTEYLALERLVTGYDLDIERLVSNFRIQKK